MNWTVSFDTPDLVYYQVNVNRMNQKNNIDYLAVLHSQQSGLENPCS